MPVECPEGRIYIVRRGDTLYRIALLFGLTVEQILEANPQITNPNRLTVGQEICIPMVVPPPGTCPGMVYIIRAGDTLYSLAGRFGVTVDAIMAANPDIDPENLQIGQRICIPIVPPTMRPRCQILNPTDITPNSKSFLFIEPEANSVLAGVSNVPAPTVLPEGEVYKLWIRRRGTNRYAVGVLTEEIPGYYIGRVVPDFPLTAADAVLITAEAAENITAPAGLGVAEGML